MPKLRAARMGLSWMFCTAAIAEVTMGNRLARKDQKIKGRTPNQRMATSIQAIGEIGRST